MANAVGEPEFQEIVERKLGSNYEQALELFRLYGAQLSNDVLNVLLHAVDQDKVAIVLGLLRSHYDTHLQFQHPEIRGMVSGALGNETFVFFMSLCEETLGLTAAKPSA